MTSSPTDAATTTTVADESDDSKLLKMRKDDDFETTKKQRRRKRQHPPPPPPPVGWTRCHAYLESKSRFCRQQVLPVPITQLGGGDSSNVAPSLYCGNHAHQYTLCPIVVANSSADRPTWLPRDDASLYDEKEDDDCTMKTQQPPPPSFPALQQRIRIPCPIDPSHMIFADMVEKHKFKCPKTIAMQKQSTATYYRYNCNCGGYSNNNIMDKNNYDDDARRNSRRTNDTTPNPTEKGEWTKSVASQQQQQQQLPPWTPGTIAGGEDNNTAVNGTLKHNDTTTLDQSSNNNNMAWAQRVALRVLQIHQQLFGNNIICDSNNNNNNNYPHRATPRKRSKADDDDDDDGTKNSNNDKINLPQSSPPQQERKLLLPTLQEICDAIPMMDLSQHEVDNGIGAVVMNHRMKSGGERHLYQQASIVGHLRRIHALPPVAATTSKPTTSFVNDIALPDTETTARTSTSATHNDSHSSTNHSTACASTKESTSMHSSHTQVAKEEENSPRAHHHTPPLQQCSRRTTIIEMGAGRGMTGLVVAGVAASASDEVSATKTHLIMIERGASRSRAEKCLRKAQRFPTLSHPTFSFNLSNVQWDRINCDLAHVDMEVVLSTATRATSTAAATTAGNVEVSSCETPPHDLDDNVIVIAKHLCGVGTDLALKSLEPICHRITACLMATCCHGVCCWRDYVGRDYLRDVMISHNDISDNGFCLSTFGEAEFELLRFWSSGTVKDVVNRSGLDTSSINRTNRHDNKDDGDDSDDEHGARNVVVPENARTPSTQGAQWNVTKIVEALKLECGEQGLGRACQRLIDYGRKEYLKHVIFGNESSSSSSSSRVELVYYVPETVTPQNAALVACR